MELSNKKKFKIQIFKGCPIYGKLKIKKGKGFLKCYDEKGKITVDLDNYNPIIINSILDQARKICEMKYSTLWSY